MEAQFLFRKKHSENNFMQWDIFLLILMVSLYEVFASQRPLHI